MGEHGKEAVALTSASYRDAVVSLDLGGEQRVVPGQGGPHVVGVLLPELGAALDVCEEVGDDSGRQLRRARPF